MIAVAGTVPARDTIDTWRDFASLPANNAQLSNQHPTEDGKGVTVKSEQNLSPIWRLETLNIPGIRQLSDGHSLSEALAAFIQSFADGSFNAAYKEVDGRVDKFGFPELFSIHVTMYWPLAAASVRRWSIEYNEELFYMSASSDWHDAKLYLRGHREHPMSSTEQLRSDLLQIRTFTSNTIVQIGNLLRLKSDGVEGWAGACSKIIGGTTMEHYAGIDVSVESACRRRGYNMPAQNAA